MLAKMLKNGEERMVSEWQRSTRSRRLEVIEARVTVDCQTTQTIEKVWAKVLVLSYMFKFVQK